MSVDSVVVPLARRPSVNWPRLLGNPALVLTAAGVFAFGTVLGAFLSFTTGTGEIARQPHADPSFLTVITRNLGVTASMAIGVASLGILTVGVLGVNGVICGAAIEMLAGSGHGGDLLTGMAPHFLPEVGAFCVAAAADLRLVGVLFTWIRSGSRPAWSGDQGLIRIWLLPHAGVVVLLTIAAAIESVISSVG